MNLSIFFYEIHKENINCAPEQLALKLGRSQSSIANKMRLLNLSDDVQEALIEEAIAKAVADYRKDYPNNTGFTRKCVLNMETMVNLDNVEDFITSDKFADFILTNTTDFGTAAFILQVVLDKIDELRSKEY